MNIRYIDNLWNRIKPDLENKIKEMEYRIQIEKPSYLKYTNNQLLLKVVTIVLLIIILIISYFLLQLFKY